MTGTSIGEIDEIWRRVIPMKLKSSGTNTVVIPTAMIVAPAKIIPIAHASDQAAPKYREAGFVLRLQMPHLAESKIAGQTGTRAPKAGEENRQQKDRSQGVPPSRGNRIPSM